MAAPERAAAGVGKSSDKGIAELGRELIDLTVAYAKQETVDPLKQLGRQVGLGVAGTAMASIGFILLVVGVVRVVEVEARLRGLWSFVPYVAALAVAGVVATVAVKQISRRPT